MKKVILALMSGSLTMLAMSSQASAQDAGSGFLRVGASRTKLADKGEIRVGGAVQPGADYVTRDFYHGTLTGGYYVINGIALEASISTPGTTNNVPAGTLAGMQNLGDDEFVMASVGASVHPFHGRVSPYAGGGYQHHFTTQERDGLVVDLRIPNAGGPYVQAGVDFSVSDRFGVFAEARKAFYHSNSTAKLPLNAAYTSFADLGARAVLDPFTLQIGVTARFGRSGTSGQAMPIETDTTRWTLRGGLTKLNLADKVKLSVGGAPYPGAGLSTFDHETVSLQVGRFLTPNIAINATLGFPPTIDIYGAGSIGALPKLGEITYGPTVLTVQYHPTRSGRVRPYVGVGVSYMIVFGTKDGAFRNLKVDNDLAPAFEAGSDFMVSQHWGIFADVKKALLRPKSYGIFAGMPVVGQTKLDPWAFSGGMAYHF